jgi:hypothetical protein
MWRLFAAASVLLSSSAAYALQLDWNGQFWFENDWLNNYQLSRGRPGYDNDPEFINAGGPYVPGTGEKNSVWYSAFLRLKPKAVVNDSLFIKSEFQVATPIYSFMGRSFPNSADAQFDITGSQRNNLAIGAQRFWANLITDFGTIELGRAPINWALGAMWNSGDNLFDRYQSTGDMIRLTSKFGNFSVAPALVKTSGGNNVSGATVNGRTVSGNDDLTDYDLAVKYDNSEEDFEFGMMWTKRTGNSSQQSLFYNPQLLGSTRTNFNIFDFYSRKKWGRFWFGGELPLINGDIGAVDGQNEFQYKSFALMFEGGYTSDLWDIGLKAGHVPGQPSSDPGDTRYKAIYLNNDYKLGLILFHYNLYGLTGNNSDNIAAAALASPYDAAIVNANYFSLNPNLKLDKWTLRSTFVFAYADTTAQAGKLFYNHQRRQYFNAINNQSSFYGWEMDYGLQFKWDENIVISWDFGFFFPGGFYAFTNDPGVTQFETNMMWASQVRVGANF